MKKQILGVLATLALCFALSSAALAAPCAKLGLSITPSTVKHGQTVTISGSVTNCSTATETIAVDYTVTGPFGATSSPSIRIEVAGAGTGITPCAARTHPLPRATGRL